MSLGIQYGDEHYLAISSTSNGVNNVVLLDSVDDEALWKTYGNSSGELLIEPKTAPGKVLCVPNMSQGTELQLCWMHSSAYSRNKWQISARWGVQLEGQMMRNWCWAASARMLADWDNGSANNVPDGRTQSAAVEEVKGSDGNVRGNLIDTLRAARFYETGSEFVADRTFTNRDQVVLTEAALRRSLDDGYIIYIARVHLDEFDNVASGHATVIGGYTTCVVGNTLTYQYIIFDPWPANKPDPWNTAQQTTGQIYTASYNWLCDGQSFLSSDQEPDNMHWWGFVTELTAYVEDTVAAG